MVPALVPSFVPPLLRMPACACLASATYPREPSTCPPRALHPQSAAPSPPPPQTPSAFCPPVAPCATAPPSPQLFVDFHERVAATMHANCAIPTTVEVCGTVRVRAFISGSCAVTIGIPDDVVIARDSSHLAHRGPTTSSSAAADRASHATATLSDANLTAIDSCALGEGVDRVQWRVSRALHLATATDGVEYDVLTYRATRNVALPFRVVPTVTRTSETELTMKVVVMAETPGRAVLAPVRVTIPIPARYVSHVKFAAAPTHTAQYLDDVAQVRWTIPIFPPNSHQELVATCVLHNKNAIPPSAAVKTGFGPVALAFEVQHQSASRLTAAFVRVDDGMKGGATPGGATGGGSVKKWLRTSVASAGYVTHF